MKCYLHNDADSVGICKFCGKGVCLKCEMNTPNSLLCSQACLDEHNELNEINMMTKKVYGIGKYKPHRKISILPIFFIISGLIFSFSSLYNFLLLNMTLDQVDYLMLSLGVTFIMAGLALFVRQKRTGFIH